MGDIADMMLEGDLCEGCGSFIDEAGGSGIPRYCSPQCAKDRGAEYIGPRVHRDPPRGFKLTNNMRGAIAKVGYEIVQHDTYHFTARDGARHVADWWPHRNKYRLHGGKATHGDFGQFKAALLATKKAATP